jgi:hypothetical protein
MRGFTQDMGDNGGKGAGKKPISGRIKSIDIYVIALLVLILVILLLYSFAFYHNHMPFRSPGYDTYSHLGILRSVKHQMGLGEELVPDMFPALYKGNMRSGVNYVIMSLIASLPGASNTFAIYIFGLLGIILFLSGIFFLTWTLSRSTRASFFAALFSLILCGTEFIVRGNSFSLVELMVDASYASIMAMGLIMFLVALNIRFLEKGTWRSYLLQVLLGVVIFNIHVLSGMQYFLILLILIAVYAIKDRSFSKRHLVLLSIIPATLLLASLWPLYHWWTVFERNAVSLGGRQGKFNTLGPFLAMNVTYFIGLPFLLKNRRDRLFLLCWALVFAIISLSFYLPISVSYYWRFANFMRIPLVIGLAMGLGVDIWKLQRWKTVAIPVILVIALSFLGFSLWRAALRYEKVMERDIYTAMEPFALQSQDGETVIAHPAPSYNLMGISSYNVVSILSGHAESDLVVKGNRRLREAYLSPVADIWRELLQDYDAEEVLVPAYPEYRDITILLNGERLEKNEYYELYEVDTETLDTEVLAATPDPELEESSVVNGFVRYADWIDIQYVGRKDVVLEPVEEPGSSYLRVFSDDPEGTLLFLNRGYIEVDPSRLHTITTTARETVGEPDNFLVVFQYAEPSPAALINITSIGLWERSEQWTERAFVIGPLYDEGVEIAWNPDTRYVKIGIVFISESTGQIEVDNIEIKAQ